MPRHILGLMVRVVALAYAAFCMLFRAHAQDSICHPTAAEVRVVVTIAGSGEVVCGPLQAAHVHPPQEESLSQALVHARAARVPMTL